MIFELFPLLFCNAVAIVIDQFCRIAHRALACANTVSYEGFIKRKIWSKMHLFLYTALRG